MLMCFVNILCAFYFVICMYVIRNHHYFCLYVNQFYEFVFKEGRSVVQVHFICINYYYRVRGAINIYYEKIKRVHTM